MGERKDLRDLLKDTDFKQKRIIDDLAGSSEEGLFEERGLAKEIKKSEGGDFIKNFFVGLLLIGIVVGSFWVSFLIGKKILVPPIKNLPTFEIPVPKPVSKAALENAEPLQSAAVEEEPILEREIKPAPVVSKPSAKPVKKTVTAQTAVKPKTIKPVATVAGKGALLYKVVAGTFSTSAKAISLSSSLKNKGFQSYVKKISSGFRVQAGAFDTREQAASLVAKLKAKGFSPSIIQE